MAIDPQKQMLDEELKKNIESGVPIAPELMEYAKSIFPSLQEQAPSAPSMGFEKTPEEIQQQELEQQQNYPELVESQIDPTAPLRKSLLSGSKSLVPKSSPLGQSIAKSEMEEEQAKNAPKFEMSPKIKQYGYDLFGLNKLAGDNEQQIPLAPKQKPDNQAPQQQEEMPEEEMLSDEELLDEVVVDYDTFKQRNPSSDLKGMAGSEQPEQGMIEEQPQQLKQQLPEEKETGVDEMIKKYREKEDQADLFKNIAKFRDAIMGAGSGKVLANTDYSMYDEMKTRAKRPIEDLLLKNQLNDTKAKNDANSDISKLMRQTLGSLGIDMSKFSNVSYSQLEKIYPSLSNTIATKIAADARKQQAAMTQQLRAEAKAEGKSLKEQQMQDRRLSELSKRTENVLKSEEYKLYNNIGTTNALIDEAIQLWEDGDDSYKQTTQAAFMGFAKAAQQDSSVVRESDMRVLAGGVNYGSLGGILQKIIAKGKGADYSPEELEGFRKAVEVIRDVKRRDLQSRFTPILSRASDVDISPDYLISPDTLADIYSAKKEKPVKDPLQQQLDDIQTKLNANQSRIESLRKKKAQ